MSRMEENKPTDTIMISNVRIDLTANDSMVQQNNNISDSMDSKKRRREENV